MEIYNASQVGVQNQQEIITLSIKKKRAAKVVTLILVEATAETVAPVIKKKQKKNR